MTKKKPASNRTKQIKKAKKKVKPPESDDEPLTFDVANEGVVLRFNIREDETGEIIGVVEDTDWEIHQLTQQALSETSGTGDDQTYIKRYTELLSQKHGVKLSTATGYKIATIAYASFYEEKKS